MKNISEIILHKIKNGILLIKAVYIVIGFAIAIIRE